MDWKDIAGPLIQTAAPTLGGILGGFIPFPGGALIGQELGQIIANQFGVDATPEAVNKAIQNAPSDVAAAKLQAAEAEAAAKWPAIAAIAQANAADRTAQSQAINAQMAKELANGQPWYAWRNLWGYSVGIEATATSWVVLYGLVFAPQVFTNIANSFGFFMSWYGMRLGLLGYIHNGASNEKIAAVTGQVPGVINGLVKAITKR